MPLALLTALPCRRNLSLLLAAGALWAGIAAAQTPAEPPAQPKSAAHAHAGTRPPGGEDYFALVTAYVDRIRNIYDGTWAYTYTTDDRLKQESSTRRINPALNALEGDVLLAVNGQLPSAERLADHRQMVEKRLQRRARNGDRPRNRRDGRRGRIDRDEKQRFLSMVIPESIEFVKQDSELLYLKFRALEEDRKNIFEHLYGILILDTEQQYIRELQVHITEPFAPYFLTKVEDGYFSVRFALIDGHPMQQAITWRVRGQAVVVWDLDADMEVVWKDFSKVTRDSV